MLHFANTSKKTPKISSSKHKQGQIRKKNKINLEKNFCYVQELRTSDLETRRLKFLHVRHDRLIIFKQ